jgi:hypothetical protein
MDRVAVLLILFSLVLPASAVEGNTELEPPDRRAFASDFLAAQALMVEFGVELAYNALMCKMIQSSDLLCLIGRGVPPREPAAKPKKIHPEV